MKLIELDAGVHQLPTIKEPTLIRSIAINPWDAIVRPSDPNIPAVNVQANVVLQGLTIRDGLHGVKCHTTVPASVVVDNCWVTGNVTNGIQTSHPLLIIRSMIEYNGSSRQYDHGVYSQGPTTISRSIVWGNSGYQITVAGSLMMHRGLIGGERCMRINPETEHTAISRCSLKGESYFPDDSQYIDDTNILIDEADELLPWWQIHPARRLYWLSERAKKWDGRGCYDYNPKFEPDPDNAKAKNHAISLWGSGHMYSVDGHWSRQNCKQPHFPGDPLPTGCING